MLNAIGINILKGLKKKWNEGEGVWGKKRDRENEGEAEGRKNLKFDGR